MLTSPQLHLITQSVARGLALEKKNVYLFCLSIASLLAQLLLPSHPCPYLCLCLILIDSVRSSADSSGSPRPLACEHACDLCSGPLPGSSNHTYTQRRTQTHTHTQRNVHTRAKQAKGKVSVEYMHRMTD